MEQVSVATTLSALLLTALAGSLHCAGMCGPIVAGFVSAFKSVTLTVNGQEPATSARRRLALDLIGYHAGRLWTYAMLGLIAGIAGQKLREGSTLIGWQRPAAIAASIGVVLVGISMFGAIPILRRRGKSMGCSSQAISNTRWLAPLVRGRGIMHRIILGAIMGLLPCGLLYGVLVLAATLPHPLLSALGMLIFGLGTLPAISVVVVTVSRIPARWRSAGVSTTAMLIILSGIFMFVRAMYVTDGCASCAHLSP
jgi:sulfite exporter TauE/SafE